MTVFIWAGKIPLILRLLWPVQAIIGRFQKISIPYHGRLLEFWGQGGGGFFELKIRRQGVTYDWNSEQVYSLKTLILWTYQFANKAWLSIDQWRLLVHLYKKTNKTLVLRQAPEALMQENYPFFSCKNSVKLFCPFIAKHGLLTKDTI